MKQDLITILPQIAILLTAVVALVFEMLRRPKGSFWTVVAGMTGITSFTLTRIGMDTTAFSDTFRAEALSVWGVLILCPSCAIAALMARGEIKDTPREGTAYCLLVFSTLGSALLAGAGDLMFIVLGVLMNGLSGFALAAHSKSDRATEGAMKYFVYGSVTGAIMVFGLAYWVGISGSTLIADIVSVSTRPLPYAFGFIALIAGVGYAASLFPFHFWTPDTFEGAPVSIAGFLSVTPKVGAVFALAQVMRVLPASEIAAPTLLAVLAACSMTYGNLGALRQSNPVRLLAYSTVAQTGYFLIGAMLVARSELSIKALVAFGMAYAAMNLGAFATIGGRNASIAKLAGLGSTQPWRAAALTVFLLSLVGIPPLLGFAGKFLLFGAAIDGGYTWLAIVAILNSVLSLAVYLRVVRPLFFAPSVEGETSPLPTAIAWSLCLAATITGGPAIHWLIRSA